MVLKFRAERKKTKKRLCWNLILQILYPFDYVMYEIIHGIQANLESV